MKILLIGTIDSINKIKSIIKRSDIDLEEIAIEDTDLLTDVLDSIPPFVDGIFATGIGVYYKIINSFKIDIPIDYAKRGAVSFSKCILDNFGQIKEFKRPSIDCLDKNILDSLIKDYNLDFKSFNIVTYDLNYGENSYLIKHLDQYQKSLTDCVFTAYGYTYNTLKKMGIPVFRLEATSLDIMDDFNELIKKIIAKNTEDQTFVIHNFYMNSYNLKFQNMIKEYCSIYEGIQYNRDDETLVISNRGLSLLETEENLKNLSIKNDIEIRLTLATGKTIKQGIDNSIYARKFLNSNNNIVFYDGDSLNFIRLDGAAPSLNILDKNLKDISIKCSISIEYIHKIYLYINNKKSSILTSYDLSKILGISRRSSIRIMDKLIQNGYAEEGIFKDGNSGRPAKSIKILF